jgi:hypothetical protein
VEPQELQSSAATHAALGTYPTLTDITVRVPAPGSYGSLDPASHPTRATAMAAMTERRLFFQAMATSLAELEQVSGPAALFRFKNLKKTFLSHISCSCSFFSLFLPFYLFRPSSARCRKAQARRAARRWR